MSAEQVLGCALGMLGADKRLKRMGADRPNLPGPEVARVVEQKIVEWFEEAGIVVAARILEKWGPNDAAVHLAQCNNAVWMRFARPPGTSAAMVGCSVRAGRPVEMARAVA